MGKEVLAIPEEKLEEVIWIIQAGLQYDYAFGDSPVSDETRKSLDKWCIEHEQRLAELKQDV